MIIPILVTRSILTVLIVKIPTIVIVIAIVVAVLGPFALIS